MFIYKYIRKDNGELLGYHLDTFGKLGSKEHAKRYGEKIDTEEAKASQTKIIQQNLESRLNPTEGSIFYDLRVEQKATEYQGLEAEQIEVVLEEVEYANVVLKVHTVVNEDGTITKYNS
jgi:hypothetical protein